MNSTKRTVEISNLTKKMSAVEIRFRLVKKRVCTKSVVEMFYFLAHTVFKGNCNGRSFDLESCSLIQCIENMNAGAWYKTEQPKKVLDKLHPRITIVYFATKCQNENFPVFTFSLVRWRRCGF